ncbi:glycosyltransferase family 4 protein [Rhodococcus opacus]|uniref:glycosyltransferase family 4 protein n=1 Tax=Rhodococcus opacus TaxID=37919 RepID=UPI002954327B|nr:glycosyltransferase family 4 protein [Rhodococcus opacus]MDV7088119.1 glycosyltransferase family 4 protein [Rhodococcus opacus]
MKSVNASPGEADSNTNGRTVLFVHSSNEMYGADRVVLQLLNAASRLNFEKIVILLPTDTTPGVNRMSDAIDKQRVDVRNVDIPVMRRQYLSPGSIFGLLLRFRHAFTCVRSIRPEILYMTTSACLLVAPVAWLLRIRRRILHVQEIWSGPERAVMSLLGISVTEIVCISDAVKNSLPKYLQRSALVVTNGVRDPGPPNLVDASGDRPIRLLIASRWNTWKGYPTLVKAWSSIKTHRTLTVLGGAPPLGIGVDVPGLVSRLPNAGTVSIVGQVDDIGPYIDEADAVIIPSDSPEPFGLVAIEAFSRGRPVIASNGGGLAEIVAHGSTGWVFDMRDQRQLARLIDDLDLADIAVAGNNARAVFESMYSEEVFIDRIELILRARASRAKLLTLLGRTPH